MNRGSYETSKNVITFLSRTLTFSLTHFQSPTFFLIDVYFWKKLFEIKLMGYFNFSAQISRPEERKTETIKWWE
jgi:hypothetical protein